MNPNRAPLYEAILRHRNRSPANFHVPGHKSAAFPESEDYIHLQHTMMIDFTELPGLDDLHQPQESIREAQELAAACFGAEQTYFLVNGSTVGNLSMLLALCDTDDLLIVQRNVHKSVIHGLMLGGIKAVFVQPKWDPSSGLAHGVGLQDVEYALQKYPQAKGVMLSNPNYFGMGIDLKPIIQLSHAYGKPVLVDEAHGAHYGFHPEVPASALSCGADAVVQSTHKMLTALTMGSMLHVQGTLLQREAITRILAILQSSSPSYPIMGSLDLCRREMHLYGTERLAEGLEAVIHFKQQLKQNKHCVPFLLITQGQPPSYETQDPFKVTVRDATGTLNGFQLKSQLEQYGCFCEMADPNYVLLVFSLRSKKSASDRLIQAFEKISVEHKLCEKIMNPDVTQFRIVPPNREVSPPIKFTKEMLYSRITQTRTVSIKDAADAISAEMVIPYPPGIPVLYPGEMITEKMVNYLSYLSSSGAVFHGVKAANLLTIQVRSSPSISGITCN